MTRTFRCLCLFLFLSFVNAFAQSPYIFEIDSLISTRNPRNFNGVILITKKGKIQYSRAYGIKDIYNPAPLKMDDPFEIMSNTKQITAVLLLQEAEKGKIDLQSPVGRYLDDLTQPWADSVTIHQLLNHTHGITDLNKPLAFKPGSDFRYGNLSTILLGKIIEKVSGQSYKSTAENLFRKLGMNDTFFYSKDGNRKPVTGQMADRNVFSAVEESFITDENLPADGVVTTAKDLSIWNEALHKGKILTPEMYGLMTTPSAMSQHDVFGKEKTGYGYNIRIVNDQEIPYYGHTGLGDGFTSLNIYFPESEVSLIILENQMNENSDLYYYFEKEIKNIILSSNLVKE
ncbi:serine hydrolase domain-containing protein [uncultured Chryseobacterium sp.]|uniref:serine hydrolase domain-containing protein n=1 Tax=uncultured Chryseobacterium sp. TaxID=259322 RepID=UPI0025FBF784|nr:serine hydrolase domain-containing protein [uncultured Chryseobacterium sp.]